MECVGLNRGRVGGEGGEWMRGLGLGFTDPLGTEIVLDVCLCLGCSGEGSVGRLDRVLGPGSGGVGGVMSV